jgi:hypothetical protein
VSEVFEMRTLRMLLSGTLRREMSYARQKKKKKKTKYRMRVPDTEE